MRTRLTARAPDPAAADPAAATDPTATAGRSSAGPRRAGDAAAAARDAPAEGCLGQAPGAAAGRRIRADLSGNRGRNPRSPRREERLELMPWVNRIR